MEPTGVDRHGREATRSSEREMNLGPRKRVGTKGINYESDAVPVS